MSLITRNTKRVSKYDCTFDCTINVAKSSYCVFSHDVMAAIFVSQNNETGAMFVSQTRPLGVELFSYVNAFFCSNKFA